MKLAIFGGTGKTGQHLVQQALDGGHEVVALARTPSKLSITHPKLKVVQGDVLDVKCVEDTIQGADAVISTLGRTLGRDGNKPDLMISRGTENILIAMKKHHVRRIVISAGAGVRDPQDRPKLIDRFFNLLLHTLSKNAVADVEEMVRLVRSSDREWVVVRVPMLTDKPAQNSLKIGYVGDITPRISRADMATFMIKQAVENTYVRKAPAISN